MLNGGIPRRLLYCARINIFLYRHENQFRRCKRCVAHNENTVSLKHFLTLSRPKNRSKRNAKSWRTANTDKFSFPYEAFRESRAQCSRGFLTSYTCSVLLRIRTHKNISFLLREAKKCKHRHFGRSWWDPTLADSISANTSPQKSLFAAKRLTNVFSD